MALLGQESVLDIDDDLDDVPELLSWYSLRVLRNEDRCVAQIKEHVAMRNLQDKVVDIKYFKEYDVVETEEYDPHSEFLPKRGFKNTDRSLWVRLPNGNYKRIRVVEKKPLSGMIFIKMVFDLDLFKMIRGWDAGYSFLGFPNPTPTSDNQLNKMAASLNDQIPDLVDYAKQKGYQVMDKGQIYVDPEEVSVRKSEEAVPAASSEPEEEMLPEDADDFKRTLSPEEEKEAQRARIYSELNIQDNLKSNFSVDVSASDKPKAAAKKKFSFNVNDFVFIKHLGFKGIIQEIDHEGDKVIVGVQMFGRRQPVECKVKDIQLI